MLCKLYQLPPPTLRDRHLSKEHLVFGPYYFGTQINHLLRFTEHDSG